MEKIKFRFSFLDNRAKDELFFEKFVMYFDFQKYQFLINCDLVSSKTNN